ncbi:hypothetical protein EXS54_01300 [Patescibacteria group bacterium]|nr:hypothetical protein [Patescibacteria group bacterium]
MIRVLAILAWLVILSIQVSLWPQITTAIMPAFGLAAALAWGLAPGSSVTGPARAHVGSASHLRTGLWLALASGALLDLYAQHHLGLLMIASGLGYASIWLVVRPPVDDLGWPTRLSAALLAAIIYELVILVVMVLTRSNFPFLAELLQVATLNVVGTVIVFAMFVSLLGALRRRFT